LALSQNDRLHINIESEENLKYVWFRKIRKQLDCEFMLFLSLHIILVNKSKTQLYNLIGESEEVGFGKQYTIHKDFRWAN
jgi:hypothetical protein